MKEKKEGANERLNLMSRVQFKQQLILLYLALLNLLDNSLIQKFTNSNCVSPMGSRGTYVSFAVRETSVNSSILLDILISSWITMWKSCNIIESQFSPK